MASGRVGGPGGNAGFTQASKQTGAVVLRGQAQRLDVKLGGKAASNGQPGARKPTAIRLRRRRADSKRAAIRAFAAKARGDFSPRDLVCAVPELTPVQAGAQLAVLTIWRRWSESSEVVTGKQVNSVFDSNLQRQIAWASVGPTTLRKMVSNGGRQGAYIKETASNGL